MLFTIIRDVQFMYIHEQCGRATRKIVQKKMNDFYSSFIKYEKFGIFKF